MDSADSNSEASASAGLSTESAGLAATHEADESWHEDEPSAPATVADSSSAEIAEPFDWSPGRRRGSFDDDQPQHRRRTNFDNPDRRRRSTYGGQLTSTGGGQQ